MKNDTSTPDVGRHVVVADQDFGRYVTLRAHDCGLHDASGTQCRHAEVDDLDAQVRVPIIRRTLLHTIGSWCAVHLLMLHHDVVRLQIPVHDPSVVAVLERCEDLAHDGDGPRLVQRLLVGDILIQVAPPSVLQHQIHAFAVLEGLMQTADVGMIELLQHADLHERLLSPFPLAHHVHDLHDTGPARFAHPGLVHGTKGAAPQSLFLHLVEIFNLVRTVVHRNEGRPLTASALLLDFRAGLHRRAAAPRNDSRTHFCNSRYGFLHGQERCRISTDSGRTTITRPPRGDLLSRFGGQRKWDDISVVSAITSDTAKREQASQTREARLLASGNRCCRASSCRRMQRDVAAGINALSPHW
mmetsp:Transcript_14398/g.39299  ORF Transcript_14398/g.39299 Transcript_14398/m.39299 type:complete len:357 (+) Transcript_14398:988-2058(+)